MRKILSSVFTVVLLAAFLFLLFVALSRAQTSRRVHDADQVRISHVRRSEGRRDLPFHRSFKTQTLDQPTGNIQLAEEIEVPPSRDG